MPSHKRTKPRPAKPTWQGWRVGKEMGTAFADEADTTGMYRLMKPRHNRTGAGPTTSTWQGCHEGKVSGSCRDDQYLTDSGGAPISLTEKEHVRWAKTLDHPMQFGRGGIDKLEPAMQKALLFEATTDGNMVDLHREHILSHYGQIAIDLEGERLKWLHTEVPKERQWLMKTCAYH